MSDKAEPTLEEMEAYLAEHYAEAIPAFTTEAVHELAVKIVTNEVYVAALGTEACTFSFGAILKLTPTEQIPRNLAALYAEYHKASEMGVNGYPFFLSASWIPAESMNDLRAEVTRLQEAMR